MGAAIRWAHVTFLFAELIFDLGHARAAADDAVLVTIYGEFVSIPVTAVTLMKKARLMKKIGRLLAGSRHFVLLSRHERITETADGGRVPGVGAHAGLAV